MSPPEQNGGVAAKKHRACDECRSRKLACSKEAEGCARCKREGIACHYSPQKPMGRPRKRPLDDAGETASVEAASKTQMTTIPPDTEDPGLAFLSFITGGNLDLDLGFNDAMLDKPEAEKEDWTFGYTGNDFNQLNFGMSMGHQPSYSTPNVDPALVAAATTTNTPSEAAVPQLSPDQSSSPSSNGSPETTGQPTCACTASLYLAIDSMQRIPKDVTAAVREARLATKAAYEVVNCPTCSMPTDPPVPYSHSSSPQMMQNFQTLMLLATLIPSVVHAYEQILQLVDQETSKAQAERRDIPFTLSGYGGTWGAIGADACGANKMLDYKMMEPSMWRLTVRALLRVDVYGLSGNRDQGDMNHALHLGLKDIVIQMENRSKSRHAMVDGLIHAGVWEEPQCSLKLHKTGETPTCLRIISIARSSVDNLVIA